MFCRARDNWPGRSLESRAVVVNLIGKTHTEKGLTIRAEIDDAIYPTDIKIQDKDMAKVAIVRDEFHGVWHYKICPRKDP